MISTFKHKKLVWVDMESPTTDEVKQIMHKYSIHPLVADELLRPTLRPKVDSYKEIVYLILHFPVFDPSRKGCTGCEIDFIIGKNFLITVHYQTINPLHELTKIFEADAMLGENTLTKNAGILFFHIVRQLYEFSMRQLDHVQSKINKIEEKMFTGFEYELVQAISFVQRDILDFRRIIFLHKEMFNSFEYAGGKLFGADFSHYITNLIGEYYEVWNTLESNRETVESLRETIDSLLTHKTNEIVKILTIMAFVTFPLMLISSLFGMNTKILPIAGIQGDFWIIIGIMIVAAFTMFGFFKYKKWL